MLVPVLRPRSKRQPRANRSVRRKGVVVCDFDAVVGVAKSAVEEVLRLAEVVDLGGLGLGEPAKGGEGFVEGGEGWVGL